MAYEDLLIHTCAIYKKGTTETAGKFGAPKGQEVTYPQVPTYTDVKCFFAKKSNTLQVEEPGVVVQQRFVVQFLPSVNIALGDIVEWNGIKYQADVPIPVRNHHIEVEVVRERD